MRNLKEHPITKAEVVNEIQEVLKEHHESLKGAILVPDMRSMLLNAAILYILATEDKNYEI